jgi:hypothetical protein
LNYIILSLSYRQVISEGKNMGHGRPIPELKLSTEENKRLVEWTRRGKTAQALAMRARIVLAGSR